MTSRHIIVTKCSQNVLGPESNWQTTEKKQLVNRINLPLSYQAAIESLDPNIQESDIWV